MFNHKKMNADELLKKAEDSTYHLWFLNKMLNRMVPFNSPHGLKVTKLGKKKTQVLLPYKRGNMNHISGLHACALATLAEFTTGLSLLRKLPPKEYRIIMKDIHMEYFYQGKMDATAEFSIGKKWMDEHIYQPLESENKISVECKIWIFDIKDNHLATGDITWQVKKWAAVKTKIS